MNGKSGKYSDNEKLLEYLSAVMSQRRMPVGEGAADWERIFKASDYHHVANLVYYMILGAKPEPPAVWKARFSEKYHKSVINDEAYKNIEEAVSWQCRNEGIHILVLDDFIYRGFYPMPEMRALEKLEFLVQKGKRSMIDSIMYRMDFVPDDKPVESGFSYVRAGLRLVFRERLHYGAGRMNRYFRKIERGMIFSRGFDQRLKEPDLFVFLMCNKAERFSNGEFDLRDLMDVWLYYRSVVRGSGWQYIIRKSGYLKIWKFTDKILKLSDAWFGSGQIAEEQEVFEHLGDFIFTKGADGREAAMEILPLMKTEERRRKKKDRKEKRRKAERLLFPGREYMAILYPIVEKHPSLLPFFWLRRLVRTAHDRSLSKDNEKIKNAS